MISARKVAADRRNAFMLGVRHYVNTKVSANEQADMLKVAEAALAGAGDITHRLNRGNSREKLQLKVALASQGITV